MLRRARALLAKFLAHHTYRKLTIYFLISFSFSALKLLSQPTSTSTLMPPSNSSSNCDAGDADYAPSSGVKVNMVLVQLGQDGCAHAVLERRLRR